MEKFYRELLLDTVKARLLKGGITGLPLFREEKGEPAAISCTIDTRGKPSQNAADKQIYLARLVIDSVLQDTRMSHLGIEVRASGHSYIPSTLSFGS